VAIKQKTTQEVEAGFRKLIADFNSYGHKIRAIMSDHEAVFGSIKVPMGLLQIEMIQTPAGMHERMAEWYIQTIKLRRKAVLLELGFECPAELDGELYIHTMACINDFPNANTKPLTPTQLFTGHRPSTRPFPFGQTGLFYAGKKTARAEWGIYIGSASPYHHGGLRIFLPPTATQNLPRGRVISAEKFVPMSNWPLDWNLKLQSQLQTAPSPPSANKIVQTNQAMDTSELDEFPFVGASAPPTSSVREGAPALRDDSSPSRQEGDPAPTSAPSPASPSKESKTRPENAVMTSTRSRFPPDSPSEEKFLDRRRMSLNEPSTPLTSIRHANVQRRVSFGPRDLTEQPLKPKGLQILHLDSPEHKFPGPLPIPDQPAIPASPLREILIGSPPRNPLPNSPKPDQVGIPLIPRPTDLQPPISQSVPPRALTQEIRESAKPTTKVKTEIPKPVQATKKRDPPPHYNAAAHDSRSARAAKRGLNSGGTSLLTALATGTEEFKDWTKTKMPSFAADQITAMRMSINEAIKDPARRDLSIQAIEKEIRNLMNMNTGTYIRFQDIPREEVGGIINCFMLLKNKVDGKGEFTSLKSRMVASKTKKTFKDLS
jgi:hypothetical protein